MQQGRQLLALTIIAALAAACGDDDGGDDDGDGTTIDASLPDAAAADAMPEADADTRLHLSQVGLYDDIGSKTVVAGALEYTPAFELWSDGAVKRRWLILPPGTTIDTSDMNRWRFPVGTKLFKEFAAPDGTLLETRLFERTGAGDETTDYFAGSFVWLPDGSDAIFTPDGADDVLGTQHDVPTQTRCFTCHNGEPGKILGFSAVQLSRDTAPNLASVSALLSDPPGAGADFRPPGDAVTSAALGYLHGNCGHCHNPAGTAHVDTCVDDGMGNLTECMLMRLDIADAELVDPLQCGVAQSLIGVATHSNVYSGHVRVVAGMHDQSGIWLRPSVRGSLEQMPPQFATEVVDMDGLDAIAAWIDSL